MQANMMNGDPALRKHPLLGQTVNKVIRETMSGQDEVAFTGFDGLMGLDLEDKDRATDIIEGLINSSPDRWAETPWR